MSFGRNIQALFGAGSLFHGMGEKPLSSVLLDAASEVLTFKFEDGTQARFSVEGDCCSHSWIEHMEVPQDVAGRTLVSVEDSPMETPDTVEQSEWEVVQSYRTTFRLDNGEAITLEYRNSSNGYYGGYLVRLDAHGDAE